MKIDTQRVQQVLLNLLTNAIKFSNQGGIIKVSAWSDTNFNQETMLRVSVRDRGIGIAEQEQTKIFTPFFQTQNMQSRAMNPFGHGLGLNICKRICEKLEGDIKVHSKIRKGSKFTFSIKTLFYQDNRQ